MSCHLPRMLPWFLTRQGWKVYRATVKQAYR